MVTHSYCKYTHLFIDIRTINNNYVIIYHVPIIPPLMRSHMCIYKSTYELVNLITSMPLINYKPDYSQSVESSFDEPALFYTPAPAFSISSHSTQLLRRSLYPAALHSCSSVFFIQLLYTAAPVFSISSCSTQLLTRPLYTAALHSCFSVLYIQLLYTKQSNDACPQYHT